MRIGFTGTQIGMSQHQKEQFVLKMLELSPVEFHHGDCEGADADAHLIVREFLPNVRIIIHPPEIMAKKACMKGDEYRKPKAYLVRNQDIVNETEFLFAAPKSNEEELRSGTWSTVRYARKVRRDIMILER